MGVSLLYNAHPVASAPCSCGYRNGRASSANVDFIHDGLSLHSSSEWLQLRVHRAEPLVDTVDYSVMRLFLGVINRSRSKLLR